MKSSWEEVGWIWHTQVFFLPVQGLPFIQGKDGQGIPCCILRGKEEGLTSSSALGSVTSPVQDSGLRMLFQSNFFKLVDSAVDFVASVKCLDVLGYLQTSLKELREVLRMSVLGNSGTAA